MPRQEGERRMSYEALLRFKCDWCGFTAERRGTHGFPSKGWTYHHVAIGVPLTHKCPACNEVEARRPK
jgi:predicted RNA-binding Zn-ribbon protein involved in translation (DUF1610 family)